MHRSTSLPARIAGLIISALLLATSAQCAAINGSEDNEQLSLLALLAVASNFNPNAGTYHAGTVNQLAAGRVLARRRRNAAAEAGLESSRTGTGHRCKSDGDLYRR